MASNFHGFLIFFFFIFMFFNYMTFLEAALVPAMYVFGDSLVDVGNNNYLNFSAAKANFYPNGIDFPTGKPTGRFCNGKNPADFLAEKVGLASASSYLSIIENRSHTYNINIGVNFASGGATIIPQPNQIFFPLQVTSISLSKQVVYYNSIYEALVRDLGVNKAKAHASKSLYLIEIGSNDIFAYFASPNLDKIYTPPQYLNLMSQHFEKQLKRLYENGARKLVVIGVGVIGCTPAMRYQNFTEGCNSEMNRWAFVFNQHLTSMLKKLKDELFGFHFSYFDGFSIMLSTIHKPTSFGFSEVKVACCGSGRLKAEVACIPKVSYCNNRDKHLFWDKYHPTQQAHHFFSDLIFNGPQTYTFPINVQTLIAI
ncbi:GDSL esterase/lipase At5g55050-like isoform X2 [Benincasa hispida]|uniref:GDSL esterase/lipase At5g55050-like isoform X2 n=1 Tax=Benincasa hispida TaxID=102211 RepID=UPI0019022E09|nr:GDSL esterase/lipase At5g55050-like isoform X2 [Benincasa hispida]